MEKGLLLLEIAHKAEQLNVAPLYAFSILDVVSPLRAENLNMPQDVMGGQIIENFAKRISDAFEKGDEKQLGNESFVRLAQNLDIAGLLAFISGDKPISKHHSKALSISVNYFIQKLDSLPIIVSVLSR